MAEPTSNHGVRSVAWGDIAFALAVLVAAAVVWLGTANLPPPRYEPVGSAALPRAIASLMALLSLIVAARAVRGAAPAARMAADLKGPLRVAGLAVLLVAVVAVMDQRMVGFRPAAAAFLFGACAILGGITARRLPAYAAFAALLSLGLHAVFTRLFYIDLP